MIATRRVAVLLLAAGRSERFGTGDKLHHPWRGKPLVRHAAETLAAMPFAMHVAVTGDSAESLVPAPFRAIANANPEKGIAHSIALGIATIATCDIDACLIALGDMPLVPEAHFAALLDAAGRPVRTALVATGSAGRAQVPALFGQDHFPTLRTLAGDRGAAALLRCARTIDCATELLADFDRPEDFEPQVTKVSVRP